jgi:membrane-bound metal-dependent hydrolase YbcI (DUF457 family)
MFIGHVAVGFASKKFAPKTSLGLLIAAPTFLDLLWPVFLLLGWERVQIDPGNTAFTPLKFVSYPYSHSLVMAFMWGALFALLYWFATRNKKGAAILLIGVISHWFLDALTHRPDMPISPGSSKVVGLGLWNSIPLTMAVESLMFFAGFWIYARYTKPGSKIGKYSFLAFVSLLVFMYAGLPFTPPPPDSHSVALFGFSGWLMPLWAWWFDRHRFIRGRFQ